MHLKSFLLSTAIGLSLYAPPANAADIARHHAAPAPIAMPAAPDLSWTGPYVGAELGFSQFQLHNRDNTNPPTPSIAATTKLPNGGIIGLYVGSNFLVAPHIIAGIEGNIDASNIRGRLAAPTLDGKPQPDVWYQYNEKYSADARLRLGYATGHFMPYIAGGASLAATEVTAEKPKNVYLKPSLVEGWNVGGGVEYAINNHLLARVDYSMRHFAKYYLNTPIPGGETTTENKNIGLTSHALRLGVAYKF